MSITDLNFDISDVTDISPKCIEEMFSLYRPYHHVKKSFFIYRTLHQFNRMVIIRHHGTLAGFFGLRQTVVRGIGRRKAAAIYFGQMFIRPVYRKNFLIQSIGLYIAVRQKLKHPLTKLYVWGDVLNYRVYVLLSHAFPHTYPSPRYRMPHEIKSVRDQLGERYYGPDYDADRGIVAKSERRVLDTETRIAPSALENPFVHHYVTLNRHHTRGDGLLVISPVTLFNVIKGIASFFSFLRQRKKHGTHRPHKCKTAET